MLKRMLCLTAVLTLTAAVYSEVIRIGSGAGPAESLLLPLKEKYEKSSGNTLDIRYIGPAESWKELQDGKVDIAFAGLVYSKWKDHMAEQNIVIAEPDLYKYRMIFNDRVITIGHAASTPDGIDDQTVLAMMTGATTSWKGIGSSDLPVTVVLSKMATGTNMLYREMVLGNKPFTAKPVWADRLSDVVAKVESTPGAIGFASEKALTGRNIKRFKTKEILRPVAALIKGESNPVLNDLLIFLKNNAEK